MYNTIVNKTTRRSLFIISNELEATNIDEEVHSENVVESPVCSTDNVWVETNMELSLSTKLNTMKTNIAGKAEQSHIHSGFSRTLNETRTLSDVNGTLSIDTTFDNLVNGAYLVSFTYTNSSNVLIDKTLYVMYYSSSTLVPTYTLVKGTAGIDNPMIANVNGNVGIATTHTNSDVTGCQVRIL